MTAAGQRRERVTFQQRAADENGDRTGPWEEPGLSRRCRVLARTRGEVVLGQRLQGLQPVEVMVVRGSSTRQITTAWRLTWAGAAYNIRAVAPTENRAEIAILAEADQTNG